MEVTKKEVFYALKSHPSGKIPGHDGLNSEFYCFFWNEIGDSLFDAITYFFNNSIIPNSWGRTFITFIPKSPTINLSLIFGLFIYVMLAIKLFQK